METKTSTERAMEAFRTPLVWRIMRGFSILFYAGTMCLLLTFLSALFFPHVVPPIGALIASSVLFALAFGLLRLLKRAAHRSTAPDYQLHNRYDGGILFVLLAGIASWAGFASKDLMWVSDLAVLATLVGGLYILFKVRAFLLRNFLVIGVGIGLAWAPIQLAGLAAAKKKAQRIKAETQQNTLNANVQADKAIVLSGALSVVGYASRQQDLLTFAGFDDARRLNKDNQFEYFVRIALTNTSHAQLSCDDVVGKFLSPTGFKVEGRFTFFGPDGLTKEPLVLLPGQGKLLSFDSGPQTAQLLPRDSGQPVEFQLLLKTNGISANAYVSRLPPLNELPILEEKTSDKATGKLVKFVASP